MNDDVRVAIIEEDKLLLILRKEEYALPGKQLSRGEAEYQGLESAIEDELPGLRFNLHHYLGRFTTPATKNQHQRNIGVYVGDAQGSVKLADVQHQILLTPIPECYLLSPITREIVDTLREKGKLKFASVEEALDYHGLP